MLGYSHFQAANLLWRLQHGELPHNLYPKVWWLSIGSNDLASGGCSEEATVLGVMRIAEELAAATPDAEVVIQGILPRSSRSDGSLDSRGFGHHIFARPHSQKYKANQAKSHYLLWPSIQHINSELEKFCQKQDHMIYFDASSLFVGSMGNAHFQSQTQYIVSELMPDYTHLSLKGYQVLGDRVESELRRIIYYEDDRNDVEEAAHFL